MLLAKNGGNAKLLSYGLDAEQLLSSRGTSPYGQLLTARNHVAVVYSSSVYLYTADLTYTDVIQAREEDGIETFDMNDDGLLIIGEQGVSQLDVYDLNHGLEKTQTSEQFVMGSDVSYSDIAIDESGAFIAVTSSGSDRPFSLFKRKTGQRIYTSLDQNQDFSYQSGVELGNESHSIIVEGANQTNIYRGKELSKRSIAFQIPKARQRVDKGSSETLALEVTRADGKKVLVKNGVTRNVSEPVGHTDIHITKSRRHHSIGRRVTQSNFQNFILKKQYATIMIPGFLLFFYVRFKILWISCVDHTL